MPRRCGRIGTIGACLLAAACSSGSPKDSASQAANTGDAGPSRLGDAGLDAGVDTNASAPDPSGTPCVDAGGDAGASPPVAPADGRCALTPTMLVAASSIATPVDAGPVLAGFGSIASTRGGLLYATYVVQNNPPDLANEYLAGALLRVPLAGGQPTDVASGHLFVKPVVSGAVAILGERGGIPPGDVNDSIAALPFDGGPPTTIFNFPTGNQLVNGIGTDGTFVYFDDLSGLQALPLAGGSDAGPITIVGTSLPTTLCPDVVGAFGSKLLFIYPQGETDTVALPPQPASQVTSLGTTTPGPTDLMACGAEACWLSGAQINGVDPDGGSIHVVVDFTGALQGAFDAVFDGTSFYAIGTVSNTSNGLVRMGTDGTCPELIATMPSEAGGSVAVDDECVYWSNTEGIFSVAKTAVGPFAQ